MLAGHARSSDDPKASPELIHSSGTLLCSMESHGFLWTFSSWVWDGEFDLKWASAQLQLKLVSKLCKTPEVFVLCSWTSIRYLLAVWFLTNLSNFLDLGQIHFCRSWFSLKFFYNHNRASLPMHTCVSSAEPLSVLRSIKLVLAFHGVH